MIDNQNIFTSLLTIPSITGPDHQEHLHACIDTISEVFDRYKNIYVHTVQNTYPHLIVTNYDPSVSKAADIILNGHIDVMPPSQDDQFAPRLEGDICYARGAGDMKAGVVSMIQVMQKLAQEQFEKKRICLMITSDEETGGYDGVNKLIQAGYTAPVVLIPDGGSLEHIVIGQKGVYLLNGITFSGPGGHASRPWLTRNPIEVACSFTNALRKKLHGIDSSIWAPSVTMTSLVCESSVNQIATKAVAKVDIRFTEHWTVDSLSKLVDTLLEEYAGVCDHRIIGPVVHTNTNDPVVQHYLSIAKQWGSMQSELGIEHGASDGRRFAQQGSTVILQRPTCGNIHGEDERVKINEIDTIADIYYHFITSL